MAVVWILAGFGLLCLVAIVLALLFIHVSRDVDVEDGRIDYGKHIHGPDDE